MTARHAARTRNGPGHPAAARAVDGPDQSSLVWAWFIHLVQDVLIFSFLAIGAITPGGA